MKNMASMKSEYFVHLIIIVLLVIIIAMLLMQGQKKESFDMEHFYGNVAKGGDCRPSNNKPTGTDCHNDLKCTAKGKCP